MHKQKPAPDPKQQARKLLQRLELDTPSRTDPQGSYTGKPVWGKHPVQDVDDL